jgi:hypothetical protein
MRFPKCFRQARPALLVFYTILAFSHALNGQTVVGCSNELISLEQYQPIIYHIGPFRIHGLRHNPNQSVDVQERRRIEK